MRLDLLLVKKGLAPTRSKAHAMIVAGEVFLVRAGQRTVIRKPSLDLREDAEIGVVENLPNYVSRGGIKLAGALKRTELRVLGLRVLDVGISTGGFTDCLLQNGASQVVGVDVGHGQLHESLRSDPRVKLYEGINARHLHESPANGEGRFQLIVVDLSFISLTLVLSQLIGYLDPGGFLLALVKPQFEVGREGLQKNGVVKNAELYPQVEERIKKAVVDSGFRVLDYFPSAIEGTDGNKEFFIFATT